MRLAGLPFVHVFPRGNRLPWILLPLLLAVALLDCSAQTRRPVARARSDAGRFAYAPSPREAAFLDTLQERTFQYFWSLSDPKTGLTPDRAPSESFVSVSATGFALTAYPIGAERGYVSRAAAADRVLTTLRFLWDLPQDSVSSRAGGQRGFFYHFLEPKTGYRFKDVELSTMDTALLLAGCLFCQVYFDREDAAERSIRAYADSLYSRADWQWASVRPPMISHGWDPENGFLPYDWGGYNEASILYILAMGSPTHPVAGDAWEFWLEGYRWGTFYGMDHLGFAPLFGHQFSHAWIDFRGIQDRFMREKGIDYFENARRAVLSQRAYAIANPMGWAGYGANLWGLTACDGPVHNEVMIDGRKRQFETYWARGASFTEIQDDGTISPSAAGGSIAFAPEFVVPTLLSIRETYGKRVFGTYGFVDALNPTLRLPITVQHGRVDPALGWFDTDYLGIDQGPILLMIENYRSGLVWKTLRRHPAVIRGLRAAGFAGGWMDSVKAGQ
jgi:hypothetical protein